jgi:HEAT repeat protein
VATGLDITFQILSKTKNEAALPWLITAFDADVGEFRTWALRALLARRSSEGHRELVRRWHLLDESQRRIVDEHPTRMSGAVRDGILSAEVELNRNACNMVVRLRDYDLIPTLVKAAEDKANAYAEQAAHAAVALAEHLSNELNSPRDYRTRRDPALIRQYVYSSLEHSVRHFAEHRRAALIEAFLLLVNEDDSLLKQMLEDPDDVVYAAIVRHLTASSRVGVMRVVLELLEDLHAPAAVLHVVGRRRDEPFVRLLLHSTSKKISPNLKSNLRKVEAWAWLREDLSILGTLNDEELCGAVHLTTSSGMNRLRAFEVVQFALYYGGELSRRAASAVLVDFKGGEANDLVLVALVDTDPEVQANAVKQLRERAIPGAMQRLIELLDSPHEIVRAAVLESLSEFTFQRYVGAFEMLDKEARQATGALVKRVDRDALGQLQVELTSQSRSRRLRGLEIAVAMRYTREVQEEIIHLSCDTDHFVRVASIPALVHINSPQSRHRLQELRMDRAASVQEAAEEALCKAAPIPDPFANQGIPAFSDPAPTPHAM